MAWGKMGSVTATGSTAGQTLSSLSDNKFIQIMAHQIPNASGNVNSLLTFNGDAGSNQYQNRYNDNGASDGTFQYTSMVIASADSVFNRFEVIYVFNIAGEEKLMIGTAVNGEGANSSTAPIRTERVSKWRNTSDAISSIKIAPASNNYVADTNISVLGSDLTPAAAAPFPSDVQVGSRAEITDTRKIYHYNPVSQADTITKDTQAIIQNGTTGYGSPDTFSSFTVGNNSNRALIVATGAYNASPSIVSVKFNGTESFESIQDYNNGNFRVELWILYNPTVTTANIVIEWGTQAGFGGAGAGQMGAIAYSFYGVKQSDAFGTPVTKNGSASATPFIPITPTETGSMIIDSWFSGSDAAVPNNDFTDGMNVICGGIDRSMASQYNLTPTIGSVNNMSRTAGNSSFAQTAVEIKASTSLVNTWTEEGT